MITPYERYEYLYNFETLYGKAVYLEYLPTAKSRKWKQTSYCKQHSDLNHTFAIKLMKQENWDSIRFVAA